MLTTLIGINLALLASDPIEIPTRNTLRHIARYLLYTTCIPCFLGAFCRNMDAAVIAPLNTVLFMDAASRLRSSPQTWHETRSRRLYSSGPRRPESFLRLLHRAAKAYFSASNFTFPTYATKSGGASFQECSVGSERIGVPVPIAAHSTPALKSGRYPFRRVCGTCGIRR